jgi:apolipoprotein N-acyltransferase
MENGAATDGPDEPFPPLPDSRWAGWLAARGCFVLTGALHAFAFPPYDLSGAIWIFAVPLAMWTAWRPRWKTFLWTAFASMFVSWLILLEWLRHVANEGGWPVYIGWVALAAVMAVYPTAWFAIVRGFLPQSGRHGAAVRVLVILGLAGAWVVIEWLRSWLLTGFPWLPLSATVWRHSMMLQTASWGGAWTISFAIIVVNLGLAARLWRLHPAVRARDGQFCPEFYVAMVAVLILWFGGVADLAARKREPLLRAGIMQPAIPQSVKWDPAEARSILEILRKQTKSIADWGYNPDAIFWPEATTPFAVVGDPTMQAWTEDLAREVKVPLVLGAVAFEETGTSADQVRWWNGIFVVEPEAGVKPHSYSKRHLVPFGEYVPFEQYLTFMKKLVPIGGAFEEGTSAQPLDLVLGERTIRIGGLICYEDVFPDLARESVAAGADVLFVATNDAWYGQTGAAYQHAAHSVLRAVETRRPVIRVGNAGWSGWIDEFGNARVSTARGSIYFRGGTAVDVTRETTWAGRQSLYVRWGEWFVGLSGALTLAAWLILQRTPPDRPRS